MIQYKGDIMRKLKRADKNVYKVSKSARKRLLKDIENSIINNIHK